jgi:hypothetical protein
MNCEEFANLGLDAIVYGVGQNFDAASEHLRACPDCASLYESWQGLNEGLRELGQATAGASAPSRVEMRLRQEFRTIHRTDKNRERAILAGWLLAAATLVLVGGSMFFWRQQHGLDSAKKPVATNDAVQTVANGPELGGTLIAESDGEQFALIPGAMPALQDETAVVRVQMQRGSLGALGLTVNEERANDLVQVDLLVGADGQPQGYRLPESNN